MVNKCPSIKFEVQRFGEGNQRKEFFNSRQASYARIKGSEFLITKGHNLAAVRNI